MVQAPTDRNFVMDSDIEAQPPPLVSSLRSRFEQLAVKTHSKPSQQLGLLSPESTGPRPRAVSTQETRPQATHLRSSSSSSDLKYGAKKPPPPPPPPRGVKPLASSSPLMRSVPMPYSTPTIGLPGSPPRKSMTAISGGDCQIPGTPPLGGVASLRHKFL